MTYIAESTDRAFRAALADYIALSEDFFVQGAVITSTPSGTSTIYAITAGHVCYKGELMPVEAHSITKLASQVVYIELQEDAVDVAPVLNLDGQSDQVLIRRRARLRVASVYPVVHMAITAPRKQQLDLLRLKGRVVMPGMILPYYGALDVFTGTGLGVANGAMDGWAICNGLNGTPDMRGMVPMGATNVPSSGAPDLYDGVTAPATSPGETVGADRHQIAAAELPPHKHPLEFPSEKYTSAEQVGSGNLEAGSGHPYQEFPAETEENDTTNTALEMRQPSFALVFVMSLA